jgi:hypothetical protein
MKYTIEGGIDFFDELYKSLDVEDNEYKTEEDNNVCLITNMPLIDKFVEMSCGHKFNYIPLYLDIKNHKQKFNNMEGKEGCLKENEIRCPYCRKKQNYVLPYYKELGLNKINGVNSFDINLKNIKSSSYLTNQTLHFCQFLTPNSNYDPTSSILLETSETNVGNCKFLKCYHAGSQINYSDKTGLENQNFGDEKYYCYKHKNMVIKTYKNQKLKEEKQKLKEEKQKIKKELKKIVINEKMYNENTENIENIENTVIGIIELSENSKKYCMVVLKSGPNKGKQCGCKILNDNLCKRHYNIDNKNKK